jgi:hypothetical protein
VKLANKQKVFGRAIAAVRDMYHNAPLEYPDVKNYFERNLFNDWLEDHIRNETDYLQSGGAYCKVHGLTPEEEAERMRYAPYEAIGRYGKLYQYGRGGKTLAPEKLAGNRSSFSPKHEYLEKLNTRELLELIRIVEAFNKHVKQWCQSIPEQWEEEKKERDLQDQIDAHETIERIKAAL